ncbi:MAG: hypothetical protein EOP91_05965 [Lysobacteraceae bacterium]|nr:MAG: hypothetical protein EOP91_05965 [Xanthomonadaceae bacterium]
MSRTLFLLGSWLLASATATAQVATSATRSSHSLHAVNSAALASAMTYCSTRHGSLTAESAGQACFVKARQVLAGWALKKTAGEVELPCSDPATYNT